MSPTEQPAFEVVRGIVVPISWGDDGEPRRVAILTPDEGEYQVAHGMEGEKLLSYLREEVEARVVLESVQGERTAITVVSFTVVGEVAIGADDHSGGRLDPSIRGISGGQGG